jgi:hypothetical protein
MGEGRRRRRGVREEEKGVEEEEGGERERWSHTAGLALSCHRTKFIC